MDALSGIAGKIPSVILAILYSLYIGWQHYDWLRSPTSELGRKKVELKQVKETIVIQKNKIREAEEFMAKLEQQKNSIRQLAGNLESTMISFSSNVDASSIIRTLSLEAKKLGISIKKINPDIEVTKDYYIEVPFLLDLRGAYVQLLVFFDRISRFQQITKIGDYDLKPTGSNLTKYVELEGQVKVVTFKYKNTDADQVIKKTEYSGKTTSSTPNANETTKGGDQ